MQSGFLNSCRTFGHGSQGPFGDAFQNRGLITRAEFRVCADVHGPIILLAVTIQEQAEEIDDYFDALEYEGMPMEDMIRIEEQRAKAQDTLTRRVTEPAGFMRR